MEITDAQKEREAISALRDAESRVNHSVRAVALMWEDRSLHCRL